MIGLGTIVNTAAIIVGGTAGTLLKNGIPDRFKKIIMEAIGLSVLVIGISGVMKGILFITNNKLDRQYIELMIFSLVIGGIVGEFFKIEKKLGNLGEWFQNKFAKGEGNFAEGFVQTSLIFCVGAMAIVGALEDGLTGSPNTLFAKAILDGVTSIVFSATMGVGVIFSAISVLIYQGVITLLAGFIQPWLTNDVISQMSMVGSVLIMAIGINLLEIRKIKVGNLVPAVFVPLVYYLLQNLFN